jgi:hypothetical protein
VLPGDLRGAVVLSAAEFEAHCGSGDILERKVDGRPAVIRTDDQGMGLVTKIWWRQGLLTSDRVRPYHTRFRRALGTLAERGIRVPRYRAHGRVSGTSVHFVIYEHLEGRPLRTLQVPQVDFRRLGRFVAELHARGVYFRGPHLGTVLTCPDGSLALIDVQDIGFLARPLSGGRVSRNLGALCAHPKDRPVMDGGGAAGILAGYAVGAGLTNAQQARLEQAVVQEVARRMARRARRRRRLGLDAPAE